MKKLTKTAILILSALMLFGCTDNNAQSGAGDTTPPVENSVTDSKNQNHALNAWYALALQGHNTDLCLKAH